MFVSDHRYVHQQSILELTSIVGQSREAFDNNLPDDVAIGKQTRHTPPSTYVALLMVASALCLGLAQMMLCAAILDGMFVALGGKSCALGWPSSYHDDDGGESSSSWIYCTTQSSMQPFSNESVTAGADDDATNYYPVSLLSMGWVLAASASVAMGMVDLSEMMHVQYFLFGCLVVSAVRFSVVLRRMMSDDVIGSNANNFNSTSDGLGGGGGDGVNWWIGPNPFQTVGPIMFNFAFVVTSPPSAVRARTKDSAYMALGMACALMGSLYMMVGLSGADVSNAVTNGIIPGNSSNLLSLILMNGNNEDGGPSVFDLCMIGLFGLSTVASVPVYCLLAKETLIHDAGVAPLPSFIFSNVLPWIIVALTYNASCFEAFVNWSGLLILGYANFSLPLLLDLKLKTVRAGLRRAISITQQDVDDWRTTTITKCVFMVVTASITMVIAVSISGNLTLSLVAFILLIGLM
ncbi:hypothetical protein ACHAWU_010211, partial [Discostella pseudostelligera]